MRPFHRSAVRSVIEATPWNVARSLQVGTRYLIVRPGYPATSLANGESTRGKRIQEREIYLTDLQAS